MLNCKKAIWASIWIKSASPPHQNPHQQCIGCSLLLPPAREMQLVSRHFPSHKCNFILCLHNIKCNAVNVATQLFSFKCYHSSLVMQYHQVIFYHQLLGGQVTKGCGKNIISSKKAIWRIWWFLPMSLLQCGHNFTVSNVHFFVLGV